MRLSRTLPALFVTLGLAACSNNKPATLEKGAGAPEAAKPAEPAGNGEKVVNLYTWADYFTQPVLDQFTKDTGIKVVVDTYESNEALQGKLQAGASGYDVIIPSDYMITIMAKTGRIVPLDHSKLPNLANLEDTFHNPSYDPGNQYSVPFQWGTSGYGYLSDKVEGSPDSWAAMLKPDAKLKGRISMLKDMREVLGAALKSQGHSVNSIDQKEIDAARQLVEQVSPSVKVFNSEDYKNLLAQGDVWLAHGWSSNFAMARYTMNDKIRYVIPREGTIIWVDNMAIPKGNAHLENAYAFINYFLDGKNGASVSSTTYGSTPNKAARQFIKPELLNDPALYPPPEVMQRLEYITDVGKATRLYDQAWTELRAH